MKEDDYYLVLIVLSVVSIAYAIKTIEEKKMPSSLIGRLFIGVPAALLVGAILWFVTFVLFGFWSAVVVVGVGETAGTRMLEEGWPYRVSSTAAWFVSAVGSAGILLGAVLDKDT